MVIGIDASRLSAAVQTGTERYSREVIAALLRLAPQHHFRLYTRAALTPYPLSPWERGVAPVRPFEPGEGAAGAEFFPLLPRGEGVGGEGNVEIVPIAQPRLWTHIGLAREIAARPPDALFIPAHVLPFSQALWPTTRSVVTIHDVGYRHFPGAHPWKQRLYLDASTALNARAAVAVVVDSDATRRDVQHFYGTPGEKISVAYPGVLPLASIDEPGARDARARFGVDEGTPYVLSVGTLQPRKNLRRLIQAWRLLIDSPCPPGVIPPVLILAGARGWGGEDLHGVVAALGLAQRVRLIGYVSDVEKAALLRGARAFAFPSLYEGFGFPVLEAQTAGVPVVCSNTSSLPEVAGAAALLVDPLDVQALAAALRQAIFDEPVRRHLIAAGRNNVTRFSWERCAQVILTLLSTQQ
ncbi:MAG: glycosyltransferase family 4 protein [Chloroflexi bacterium]|nr:glycosyltransferase family 4 protein [Chloroflexota bacterium]